VPPTPRHRHPARKPQPRSLTRNASPAATGKTIQAIALLLANRKDPREAATDVKGKALLAPPPPPPPPLDGTQPAGSCGADGRDPLLRIKATLVVCPGKPTHATLV
jgi:hypothetical protein